MLLINKDVMAKVHAASCCADVCEMLQGAVKLELATLPPYLTGVFSVMPGTNVEALGLVQSVALEEMLHVGLAANTLIAIGGSPHVRASGLGLHYPGPLPMTIDEGLVVHLRSLTRRQVHEVFMGIEHPDTNAILPGETEVQPIVRLKMQGGYESIGDFYQAIITTLEKLVASGDDPFANPQLERQVDLSGWFAGKIPQNPTGKVHDMDSARSNLTTIVEQGEGTNLGTHPIDPYGGSGESLAHYFKFGEIYYGRRLVEDSCAPSGWSYSGEPVPLDEQEIYRFPDDAAQSDYSQGSAASIAGDQFYQAYLRLLNTLESAFNGNPAALANGIGVMYELKLVAGKVVQHPALPHQPHGAVAAPPFQLEPAPAPS